MAAAEWTSVSLSDVLERVKRPVQLQEKETYRTLGIRSRAGGVFLKDPQKGREIAAKTLFAVEAEDVVYSRLFSWQGSFGVADQTHAGAVASGEFPTFRAHEDLLPEFFRIWASRPPVWEEAELMCTGTTAGSRNRLKEEDFLTLEMDLPPVEQQRGIVDAVLAIESVVISLERENAAAEVARAAAREQLLEDLETVELAEVIAGIDGGLGAIPKGEERPPREGEWGIVKVSAIRPGQFFPDEAKTLPTSVQVTDKVKIREGDVLVTRCSGSTRFVGAACRVPFDPQRLILTDFVMRFRFTDAADPEFMVEALASRSVRAQIEGDIERTTTLRSVSKTRLRSLEVPYAPLERQREIASVLSALREAGVRTRAALQAAQDLRASLVDSLLVGERRVREDFAALEELASA